VLGLCSAALGLWCCLRRPPRCTSWCDWCLRSGTTPSNTVVRTVSVRLTRRIYSSRRLWSIVSATGLGPGRCEVNGREHLSVPMNRPARYHVESSHRPHSPPSHTVELLQIRRRGGVQRPKRWPSGAPIRDVTNSMSTWSSMVDGMAGVALAELAHGWMQ
jgi:hypothetical protein